MRLNNYVIIFLFCRLILDFCIHAVRDNNKKFLHNTSDSVHARLIIHVLMECTSCIMHNVNIIKFLLMSSLLHHLIVGFVIALNFNVYTCYVGDSLSIKTKVHNESAATVF